LTLIRTKRNPGHLPVCFPKGFAEGSFEMTAYKALKEIKNLR